MKILTQVKLDMRHYIIKKKSESVELFCFQEKTKTNSPKARCTPVNIAATLVQSLSDAMLSSSCLETHAIRCL